MLKRSMLNMLLPALAVLPGMQAGAADLNISGKVIASACTVSSGLVSGQAVSLGSRGNIRFQNAGDADPNWHDFSLNLTDCPVATTSSTVTFTGTADATDATLFANTEPGATAATNIAVQMAKAGDHSAILSNGSTMTVNVNSLSATATFPLTARMYTPTGSVQAGRVSSTVLVDFTYQ